MEGESGLISTFLEITGKQLVGRPFCPPHPEYGKLRRIIITILIIRMLLTTTKIGKHHFTDKSSTFNNIRIVENDRILDRNEEITNTFYDFILKYFLN